MEQNVKREWGRLSERIKRVQENALEVCRSFTTRFEVCESCNLDLKINKEKRLDN